MIKYVALLRGINVGGNNIIKMSDLKEAFIKGGFTNVLTYINSGNVIFESDKTIIKELTEKIEKMLTKRFNINLRVVLLSYSQLKHVVLDSPENWKKPNDIRMYVAFLTDSTSPQNVLQEMELKDDIDSVKAGTNVVYMSTKLSGLTKSKFSKMVGKTFYKNITIRNFSTSQKILAIMEENKE